MGFLKLNGKGDVMAESRGGTEDLKLKEIYTNVWEVGTWYHSGQEFRNVFTSKQLKLRKKDHDIAGLQLADLLAYPSKIDVLTQNNRSLPSQRGPFTQKIISTIRVKYNPYGRRFLE